MDEQDPGLHFFPDGNVDLYGTLGVDKDATQEQIKKAYKKLALKFHPDKVLSSASSGGAEDAIQQFQKIGFAYAVLSDEVRRRKFDNTGSTAELMFGEGDADFDWNDYFKQLWTGEVSRQTLDDFKRKYQNSSDEKDDILEAYNDTNGDLAGIFDHVPCCEFVADEARFVALIDDAIAAGELQATPAWKRSKSAEGRKALRAKAQGEAAEAEKLARELGVWDDLFGDAKAKAKPTKAAGKDTKTKAARGKAKSSNDDDDDLGGLAALIQRKNQNRASKFDDMIAKLEAKAGVKEKRPTDEEFDRIQADMLARKNGGAAANKENKKRTAASSASTAASKKKAKK
ncbi:related to DnaJ protein [Moesziomyces antarcticus]|uniref:Related to DnaJ protein n=1 Tax=Pseudozyma antarctica TaxID=84753 RepID=A0A5C3FTV9_PSEA2|nr:related to DnaJ protein [Moesziomyces antarcticus]